ncbi:serine hydrolase domain-containing protein [Paracidobacterium acidisoli]|uniref:Class C beta-lactamase-related serine hydrolase n=1 Tax=Paracidobacterium acidisoli TaxID=2303751 RepID=A0A372IJ93_9BACT|nr:serine hydrolase [Paracidobacterium acidisoli]MBT9333343.1 serine hydrolase [Paracidobacterium acidisoli]
MPLTRRTLLSLPAALPLLSLASYAGAQDSAAYFPPSDAAGGWRALDDPSDIRTTTGIDKSRLDEAFQYVRTTSQHGGLLVVRHGYLVYERYFGRGHRDANPNMYSIGKMFTSVCCGILLSEHRKRFPDGLSQKVFTRDYLPEALPLKDPRMADIRLGHLLTMTSGIQEAYVPPPGAPPSAASGHLTAIVHGENVYLPYWTSTDPAADQIDSQDGSALHGRMWTAPGQGYLYSRDPHIASIVLRNVAGMELQTYIDQKLARSLEWGRWGYATHRPQGDLPHTPGEGGIALHSTDALRFAWLLLRKGQWKGQQIIPRDYIDQLSQPSLFNPHSPFSLMFEVNADGHVAGAPRDTFFKSGAGGFGLYVIPSLDMVIYKMSSLNEQTYDPAATGLPLTYTPDTSRDNWKPHPFNQFVDGPVEGDTGVRRALEMVIASVVA